MSTLPIRRAGPAQETGKYSGSSGAQYNSKPRSIYEREHAEETEYVYVAAPRGRRYLAAVVMGGLVGVAGTTVAYLMTDLNKYGNSANGDSRVTSCYSALVDDHTPNSTKVLPGERWGIMNQFQLTKGPGGVITFHWDNNFVAKAEASLNVHDHPEPLNMSSIIDGTINFAQTPEGEHVLLATALASTAIIGVAMTKRFGG